MSLTYIKDGRNYWTVVVNNKTYQFNPSNTDYDKLVEMVKHNDGEGIVACLDKAKAVSEWCDGDFRVSGGVLYYKNEEVHHVISQRIMEMIEQGFDYKPMLRFLENLYKNPSYRAITELYGFLSHKHLPITPDGCFLAYKAVRSNFTDKHSGKFDNTVGSKVTMPRYHVDDNCDVGCSRGLHVGTISYVQGFANNGDNLIICKVNPMNVVSVPLDHNEEKVRCCEYEVVGMYQEAFQKPVEDSYYDEDDDDYYDEDEDYYDEEEDDLDNDDDTEYNNDVYFGTFHVDYDNRDE